MDLVNNIIKLKEKYPNVNIDAKIKEYLLVHTEEELNEKIIYELNREIKDPTFYTLRVGYECNNYCIHCFVEDKRYIGGNKTFEEIINIIDSIEDENTLIIITGGEPTIRPDLLDILKYIKKKGFENSIQTNGLKFHDIEYLKTLQDYIDSIVLPIHSSDEQIFDNITRVKGSYKKIIKGFENLIKLNIKTSTQTVINKLNYPTLLETYDMIQQMKPGIGMTLTFPHPIGGANNRNIVPKLSEIKPFLKPVLRKYRHLMHTHYIPKCLLYPYHGDVSIIDETDDGNTYKPGIDYVDGNWKNVDYGKFQEGSRIKSIKCKDCVFDDNCIGVWTEYTKIYGELDINPIKYGKKE